jgi:hypothetical protein
VEVQSGHLAVKRKGVFVRRWPLRGAKLEGHARFLQSLDTVAHNVMELFKQAAETKRLRTDVSLRC